MVSKLRCLKCQFQSYVTDVFNMLSLSLPSNKRMEVSGYIVPFVFSETIRSFKFDTTEKLKYSEILEALRKENSTISYENYKMYFLLSSRLVGN